ncbi:hypothetical protein GDO81_025256 [Engystomops pustulosus]|uniref:Uncharacterized protein n=1 Tax=Engystomops pustulosus TaxID=76066 RepID=A0AAV6YK01_ENGPU|nr:hypothetical protein GDO81_025256 [Engystomops pustulosus]
MDGIYVDTLASRRALASALPGLLPHSYNDREYRCLSLLWPASNRVFSSCLLAVNSLRVVSCKVFLCCVSSVWSSFSKVEILNPFSLFNRAPCLMRTPLSSHFNASHFRASDEKTCL